jgi:hypothetical protein
VISLRHHGRQGSKEQEGCRFEGFDGFDRFGGSVGFDGFLIHEALVRSNPPNVSNPPNRQMLFI